MCASPLLSQNLQQRRPGMFLSRSLAARKRQPLSQSLSSLQTKADFDECLDFKMFWGKVSLLTEHFLSVTLVNWFENDSQNVKVYLFQI